MDKLGAVGEPESLTWLKDTTEAMLPRIDLPDLLFEVHSWTSFLDAFGHVSERRTRMEGLLVSLVALLVAESCNIGLTPVSDPENKVPTPSPRRTPRSSPPNPASSSPRCGAAGCSPPSTACASSSRSRASTPAPRPHTTAANAA